MDNTQFVVNKKHKIPTYSDCQFRRFFVILHLLYNIMYIVADFSNNTAIKIR